jgi:tyrosinase
MMDPFNSPNDPLFFLHHANLDYLWAIWQKQDGSRLSDYSAQRGEDFGANTKLSMGVIAPEKTAKDVIDTNQLCFKYDGLPVERYIS